MTNGLVRNGMNGGLLSAMQGGRGRKNRTRRRKGPCKSGCGMMKGGSRAQNEERVGYGFRGGVQEGDARQFMGSYAPFEKMSGGRRHKKSRRRGRKNSRKRSHRSSRFRRSRYHKKHGLKRRNKRNRKHTKKRQRGGNKAYTPSYSVAGQALDKHSSALANPPLFTQTNHCTDTYKHA